MASLVYKVGADTSQLRRGLSSATQMIGKFAKRGAMIGGAALGAAAAGAMVGLKKSIDLGSELSDVAANTGIAAGEVLLLRQAFDDAGVGAEKVQGTLGKMSRAIVDAQDGLTTQIRAFEALGLQVDNLAKLSPDKQFQAIAGALAAMEDPTQRAARAMQIFGRSGQQLGALVSNPAAFKNAAVTLGSSAEIFNRSANLMDRAADLIASFKTKVSGFFAGMAESLVPTLVQALETINKIDFAAIGQKVGRAAAQLIEAFKRGEGMGLIADVLRLGALKMADILLRGIRAAVAFFQTAMGPIFETLGSKLTDGQFWAGWFKTLQGIFGLMVGELQSIVAQMMEAVGKDPYDMAKDAGEKIGQGRADIYEGKLLRDSAGDGKSLGDVIMKSARDGADAAKKAFGEQTDISGALSDAADRLKKRWDDLGRSVDERTKKAQEEANAPAEGGPIAAGVARLGEQIGQNLNRSVSSLQRVGGAALNGALNMDAQRNTLLTRIERNTRGGSVARFA